jgi:uncharacterized protein (DUF1810 family)
MRDLPRVRRSEGREPFRHRWRAVALTGGDLRRACGRDVDLGQAGRVPCRVPPTSPTFDLDRFKLAQGHDGSFDAAMAELRAGRKTTHWIWWVFPQVAGLGESATSALYALAGHTEARAYLADDLLRTRLVEAVSAVHEQLLGPSERRIDRLMGSEVDALKLVSSMTLFADVAKSPAVRDLPDVEKLGTMAIEILDVARGAGYSACSHTLGVLRGG